MFLLWNTDAELETSRVHDKNLVVTNVVRSTLLTTQHQMGKETEVFEEMKHYQ